MFLDRLTSSIDKMLSVVHCVMSIVPVETQIASPLICRYGRTRSNMMFDDWVQNALSAPCDHSKDRSWRRVFSTEYAKHPFLWDDPSTVVLKVKTKNKITSAEPYLNMTPTIQLKLTLRLERTLSSHWKLFRGPPCLGIGSSICKWEDM
jgi:hypothetical protein